jgi:hypothetical protein
VPSEHSDQEECDHVSTPETDSDGDNVTAPGDSAADSERDGGYEAKIGQIWNKLPRLVSHNRKHKIVIGKPGLNVYGENISCLAENLKLFISNDILNEICYTNAEGSSQIPNLWEYIISEELFAFWGLCIVSGILGTSYEPIANL